MREGLAMKRALGTLAIVGAVMLGTIGIAAAYTFPSTNDFNRAHHGPYVDAKSAANKVDITFVNPNPYYACFEYRTNGDTSQATGRPNFNPEIPDLYPYVCLASVGSSKMSFKFVSKVEVRSVFGGERDWDFNWTTFTPR
jgi:hypothetical protein